MVTPTNETLLQNNEIKRSSIFSNKHLQFSTINYKYPQFFLWEKISCGEVIVYIWDTNFKEGAVGHTAVAFYVPAMGEQYVSYWPVKPSITKNVKAYWSDRKTDYEGEMNIKNSYKNACPSFAIKLKNLDTRKMYQAFLKIKQTAKYWSLRASSPLNKDPNAFNCVSVVMEILKAGGIEELAGMKIVETDKNIFIHDSAETGYAIDAKDVMVKQFWNLYFGGIGAIFILVFWALFAISVGILIFSFVSGFPFITPAVLIIASLITGLGLLTCAYSGLQYKKLFGVNSLIDFARYFIQTCCLPGLLCTHFLSLISIPYDKLRALTHATVIPSGRIKEVLLAAKRNELNLSSEKISSNESFSPLLASNMYHVQALVETKQALIKTQVDKHTVELKKTGKAEEVEVNSINNDLDNNSLSDSKNSTPEIKTIQEETLASEANSDVGEIFTTEEKPIAKYVAYMMLSNKPNESKLTQSLQQKRERISAAPKATLFKTPLDNLPQNNSQLPVLHL